MTVYDRKAIYIYHDRGMTQDDPNTTCMKERYLYHEPMAMTRLWAFCHVVVKTGKIHGNNRPGKNRFLPGGKTLFFAY